MSSAVLRVFESCPLPVRQEAERRGWRVVAHDEEDELPGAAGPRAARGRSASRRRVGIAGASVEAKKPLVVYWRNARFTQSEFKTGHERGERMNHFPHTKCLTKKDLLIHSMRKMRAVHGRVYDFLPVGFILPSEYTKFVHAYAAEDAAGPSHEGSGTAPTTAPGAAGETCDDQRAVWICKPSDLSRGRKIFLIKDLSELHYDQQYVVQRYVPNPLTIGGYKVDLRVYVLVTSMQPLRIHIFRNGLARFGTEKYDNKMQDIENLFSHLTNSSINKFSNTFSDDKDVIGSGSKWDFAALRQWFEGNQHGERVAFDVLWQKICDIAICTILTAVPSKPSSPSCFELFGFDILVDEALRPWLLEVNCAPALSIDGVVDRRVKEPLVRAVFDLIEQQRQQPPPQQGRHLPQSRAQFASLRRRGARVVAQKHGKVFPGATPQTSSPSDGPPSTGSELPGSTQRDEDAGRDAAAPPRHVEETKPDSEDSLSQFQCIFPFDDTSAQAALLMATSQGRASQRVLADCVRSIVQQVKRRRRGPSASSTRSSSSSASSPRSTGTESSWQKSRPALSRPGISKAGP